MQHPTSSLFNRPDTLLGVCEGLGQDFGFNPLYLRVALSVGVLWSPIAVVVTYVVLGVAVTLSRLIVPVRTRRAIEGNPGVVLATESQDKAITGENDQAPVAVAA